MEDYSIIRGQTLLEMVFALLLTIVTAYVYGRCRIYAQRRNAGHVAKLKTVRQPTTQRDPESSCGADRCSPLKKQKLSLSDWLASVIVWAAVVSTVLAVLGTLRGEN